MINRIFKSNKIIIILIVTVSLSGCYSGPELERPLTYKRASSQKSLAVMPMIEMRTQHDSKLWMLKCLIPLVPYADADFETPEYDSQIIHPEIHKFLYKDGINIFSDDLLYQLKDSKLFKNIYKVYSPNEVPANYLLETELLSTKRRETGYMYGISCFATFFWFLGAPSGENSYFLDINYRLIDNDTGDVILEKNIETKESYVTGLYYPTGEYGGGIWNDTLVKDIYNALIRKNINTILPEIKNIMKKVNKREVRGL